MMRCHTTWIAAAHGAAVLKCQVEGHVEVERTQHHGWTELPRAQKMLSWERHMEALPGYL